jgi:hypothetical protein
MSVNHIRWVAIQDAQRDVAHQSLALRTCAGYLDHPFKKSGVFGKMIPLSNHSILWRAMLVD